MDCGCVTVDDNVIENPNTTRSPQPVGEPQVLEPDNPLMQRFQAALKNHLLNQKKRLDEEIADLEALIREDAKVYKQTMEEREADQLIVDRQISIIEKEKADIEKTIADREKSEVELKEEKKALKEVEEVLSENLNKEMELRLEKESLSALIMQFTEWEQSQNSEISVAQRISEKNKSDKTIYTKEKIYQDLLLVNMTSEVLKLTTQFGELEKNIKQKQSEVDIISQSVADGTADLEALERENKRLMRIWNSVIQQIQQRDKVMMDLKAELIEAQSHYSRLMNEIESYKRSSEAEMKRNATLTEALVRLQSEKETLVRCNANEDEKQRKTKENLVKLSNMVELTERDLDKVLADIKAKETKLAKIQTEIDKLLHTKQKLEEEIVSKLHNQVLASKAEKQTVKMITEMRNEARKVEAQVASAQNEHARLVLQLELENKALKEQTLTLDEEKRKKMERDQELKRTELELKNMDNLIARKQNENDQINAKLAEANMKTAIENMSPVERQVICLEKTLNETLNEIQELHASWLREQNRIVGLTQEQNSLLNQLSIYQKQILVMKQKQMKTEFEIEDLQKEEADMKHEMSLLEKRLTNVNLKMSERKEYKENLDSQNLITQNQLICDLKDAEVKALTLQEEICYLEIEKEELRGQIVEAQRELLAWEKKLQMASEVKTSIEKSRSEGGDIAVMKSEIHRMEVRYAQLQKAQEKLAQDMEMCVSRRDGIVELAQAKEKRSTKRALYTRQQFQKKLDDLQNKIKQINTELKNVNKSITTSEEHVNGLAEKERLKKEQLTELQTAVGQMQAQLAEGQLHRQKNLEMLVRKQRKARQYGDYKAGRYSLLFRQESALDLEAQKQKTMNADLMSIVESLSTDFPTLQTPLVQILNTLRSPPA